MSTDLDSKPRDFVDLTGIFSLLDDESVKKCRDFRGHFYRQFYLMTLWFLLLLTSDFYGSARIACRSAPCWLLISTLGTFEEIRRACGDFFHSGGLHQTFLIEVGKIHTYNILSGSPSLSLMLITLNPKYKPMIITQRKKIVSRFCIVFECQRKNWCFLV